MAHLEHSKSSLGAGNTKPKDNQPSEECAKVKRINPSKFWCATIYNHSINEILMKLEHGTKYIMGNEICPTTGRKHIQAFFEFRNRIRPLEKFKSWGANWRRAGGNDDRKKIINNVMYCSKDEDYVIYGFEKPQICEDEIIEQIVNDCPHKKAWKRYEFVEKTLFRLMYKSRVLKPIKNIRNRKEYCLHIYNLCFPGETFLNEPPEMDLNDVLKL